MLEEKKKTALKKFIFFKKSLPYISGKWNAYNFSIKVFLIFQQIELSCPKSTKLFILFQKNLFLYFWKLNFLRNLLIFEEGAKSISQ